MIGLHALIGLGEALITGSIVSLICQQRPDLIYAREANSVSSRVGRFIAAGLVMSLAIGAFLAPFASELPDGLDAVAEKFSIDADADSIRGLFPEYDSVVPLEGWQSVSVSVAGVGGTLLVFVMAWLLGRVLPVRPAISEAAGE